MHGEAISAWQVNLIGGYMADKLRKISELKIGVRFSYRDYPDDVWVMVDDYSCGKCVSWSNGIEKDFWQSICSIAESEDDFKSLVVIVKD